MARRISAETPNSSNDFNVGGVCLGVVLISVFRTTFSCFVLLQLFQIIVHRHGVTEKAVQIAVSAIERLSGFYIFKFY